MKNSCFLQLLLSIKTKKCFFVLAVASISLKMKIEKAQVKIHKGACGNMLINKVCFCFPCKICSKHVNNC